MLETPQPCVNTKKLRRFEEEKQHVVFLPNLPKEYNNNSMSDSKGHVVDYSNLLGICSLVTLHKDKIFLPFKDLVKSFPFLPARSISAIFTLESTRKYTQNWSCCPYFPKFCYFSLFAYLESILFSRFFVKSVFS